MNLSIDGKNSKSARDKVITIAAIGTQEDICNLITSKEKLLF